MADHPGRDDKRQVSSVHRLFEIVNTLQDNDGMGVTELADEVGLAKSTVHDYLSTLRNLGYVVAEEGTYSVGLGFLDHGIYARDQVPITDVARPAIEAMAADTEEAVLVATEQNGRAVYLDIERGRRAVPLYVRTGSRAPLHCLASGKAMLAHMSRNRVEEIIENQGLEQIQESTITDPDELFSQLEEIRELGYAINDNEAILGTRAVGAAVVADGMVHGAVSVAGPANRLQGDHLDDVIQAVVSTTNELELKLLH